ncbi:hypothetical protein [Ramlibacter rhizophilus]|uniref:Uncharacterized protein n=1 Tax=Ramlibacter rhizophilus TaxID=1781167 RepID=A0A4Z0BRL6_9BURK|nr:hypothetical protein [Ramlibacter rhizophilus]TFZ01471.1 hypothetical protein EZ242_08855 [Ramlibacter rhizophilus]
MPASDTTVDVLRQLSGASGPPGAAPSALPTPANSAAPASTIGDFLRPSPQLHPAFRRALAPTALRRNHKGQPIELSMGSEERLEQPDTFEPSAAACALPQMRGAGWMRDLREAMSLGTRAARTLESAVRAFAASTERSAQRGTLLEAVIDAWTATGEFGWTVHARENRLQIVLHFLPFKLSAEPGPSPVAYDHELTPESIRFYQELNALYAFNGVPYRPAPPSFRQYLDGEHIARVVQVIGLYDGDVMEDAWHLLADSVYTALALQTRLKPYVDATGFTVEDDTPHLHAEGLAALLVQLHGTHPRIARGDLLDFIVYFRTQAIAAHHYEPLTALLRDWIAADGDLMRKMMDDARVTVDGRPYVPPLPPLSAQVVWPPKEMMTTLVELQPKLPAPGPQDS